MSDDVKNLDKYDAEYEQWLPYVDESVVNKQHYLKQVKDMIVKNAAGVPPDQVTADLILFLQACSLLKLNPLLKHIYAIYRKDDGTKKLSIQVSIHAKRMCAERTGFYGGSDAPKYTYDSESKLQTAAITVYKINEKTGERMPTTGVAHFEEYAVYKAGGQLNTFWKNKPQVMLAKCAESNALDKAFPMVVGQVYISEEMGEEPMEVVEADAKDKEAAKIEAKKALKGGEDGK